MWIKENYKLVYSIIAVNVGIWQECLEEKMFTRNIYMDFINELKTYFRLIEVNMRKNDFVELELV